MMKKICFIVFLSFSIVVLYSCVNERQGFDIARYDELRRKILTTGDTKAYNELSILAYKDNIEMFSLSRIMANKYEYPYASFSVYNGFILNSSKDEEYFIDYLNFQDKCYALYYLNKAYIQGEKNSMNAVSYYMKAGKDYFIRNSESDIKLNSKYVFTGSVGR